MGLMYEQISAQEFAEVKSQLAQVALAMGDKEASAAISRGDKGDKRPEFFKVPFAAVPDLVGRRNVLLRGGFAYVGRDQVGRG
jgi:DNA primase large subunit